MLTFTQGGRKCDLDPASKLSRVIVEFGWLISIVVVYSNGPDSVVP